VSAAQLTQYYRSFELPWEIDPDEQQRFRRMLLIGLAIVLVFGLLFPLINLPPRQQAAEDAVPPRLARLMEKELPKPPPPKPVEPPKPEPEPVAPPKEPPKPVDTRKKMEQSAAMRAIKDELADLRDQLDTSALQNRNLTAAAAQESRADRSLIASRVGTGSAGISNANTSRGFGGGAGSLTGHDTSTVNSRIAAAAAASNVSRTGNSGKGARGNEEIELIFDRNKGAIYALYNRALRDMPELQGKLVLELTISPAGDVTDCRVISSELGDVELERKIVARVRLFKFEARDVETITARKTIEFFPA
jgi:TonB family protein